MKAHGAESAFDQFVRERGLTDEQVEAWIEWISESYDGPLYTWTWDEVKDYYRRWARGLLVAVLADDGLGCDLDAGRDLSVASTDKDADVRREAIQ